MVYTSGYSEDLAAVSRVIAGYDKVRTALANNNPIPYSNKVSEPVKRLTSVLNGRVTSLGFGIVGQEEISISQYQGLLTKQSSTQYKSWGTITGMVETLTQRNGVKFNIRDAFDRLVKCHVTQARDAELLREAWGTKVAVTGLILRHLENDKPLEIRQIKSIEPVEDVPRGTYRRLA